MRLNKAVLAWLSPAAGATGAFLLGWGLQMSGVTSVPLGVIAMAVGGGFGLLAIVFTVLLARQIAKDEEREAGPKIVGDLVLVHEGPPEFGYATERLGHTRRYVIRINQRARNVLLVCRDPLLDAMVWLSEWNTVTAGADPDTITTVAEAKVQPDHIAVVEFGDDINTFGSLLQAVLASTQPIEVLKIEARL